MDRWLWVEKLAMLPRPHRLSFLDTVSQLSHEASDAWRRVYELEMELDRLRSPPTRAHRLDERDTVIREAIARYDGPPTVRAKTLANDLARAAELKNEPLSDRLRSAQEIVRLNGGRPLGWRQIQNIADGYRRE